MRDQASNELDVLACAPAVYNASKTDNPIIDRQGASSLTFHVNVGAVAGSGNMTPKLVHGDASDLSGGEDVPAADLIGSFPAALVAASAVKVGYRGAKRYVRLVLTLNSGTSVAVGATATLGHLDIAPKS